MNRLRRIDIGWLFGLLVLLCQTGWCESVYKCDLHFTTNTPISSYSATWSWGRYRTATDSLPNFVVSDKAIVFTNHIPTKLPIIADESRGTGTGYSRLWVDLNGDGKYGDKEYVTLTGSRKCPAASDFRCFVNNAGHKHWVSFGCRLNLFNREPELSTQTKLAYEGSFDLDGLPVFVSLCDEDADGRVAEFLTENERGAELYLSWGTDTNRLDHAPLARTMGLFGHFFAVDVSLHGDVEKPDATLFLTPVEPETETLRFSDTGITSVVLTDSGRSLILHPDGACCKTPVGAWQPQYMIVNERGQDFMAELRFSRTQPIVVQTGCVNYARLGGPLKHKIVVNGGTWSGRVSAHLSYSVGIGDEKYTPIRADGCTASGWILRRPGGSVIASGDFRYG